MEHLNRRGFLAGILAAAAAPAIVRPGLIMPIKPKLVQPDRPRFMRLDYKFSGAVPEVVIQGSVDGFNFYDLSIPYTGQMLISPDYISASVRIRPGDIVTPIGAHA